LETVTIYPWPTREEFDEAFLAYNEVRQFQIGPLPGIKSPDLIDTIPKAPTIFQPISLLYEEVIKPIQWNTKKRKRVNELPEWK
jgi:hypothetical protein